MNDERPESIIATFHPQREENDQIYDISHAQVAVDVTERVLMMQAKDIRELKDDYYNTDDLCPEQREAHSGPFRINVTDRVCAFFDVKHVSHVVDSMVLDARARLGIGKERDYEVDISRTVTRTATIKVRATSYDEAKDQAIDKSGDIDFNQFPASPPVVRAERAEVIEGVSRPRPR